MTGDVEFLLGMPGAARRHPRRHPGADGDGSLKQKSLRSEKI
jgi:hypothetical protein